MERHNHGSSSRTYQPRASSLVPRYSGPPELEMSTEQRSIRDDILKSRPKTGLRGPFGPWIAVPEIARPAQLLGRACRYGTSLTRRESELVILLTGAKFRSDAEFDIHVGEAMDAGLSLDVIQSIPRDDYFTYENIVMHLIPSIRSEAAIVPTKDDAANRLIREESIIRFTAELLENSNVSDDTYNETKNAVKNARDQDDGDKVLVEITSIVGYYTFVAYTLNVFRLPSASQG